ncbi:hypothetical protein PIROE2DRAFT_63566 [Piromyces sp. E2]|nr:hypothetical protein PIROE2DRAFT_63566 [Piromyces sp. E2]|eukprot:OUM59754.1 hypothetical protein PIROE2DRAFT_63566 [Piromyces sp. E2]
MVSETLKDNITEIIEKGNIDDLKYFLTKNIESIEFNEHLYETAFKYNKNLEAVKWICKSNWIKNKRTRQNNREYRCTENLKNILRNERFKFTSDFIITLLKYERLDYVKYIFADYLYNNECIINCLLIRKRSNRKNKTYKKIIKTEQSKIKININNLFLKVKKHGPSRNQFLNMIDYILDCANKHIITLNVTIPYVKLLLYAFATNNTKAVEWVLVQAKEENIIIDLNNEIFYENSLSISLYKFNRKIVELILDYANEHNLSLNLVKNYNKNKICFPIMNAIIEDKLEIIIVIMKYLIEKDINFDINYQDDFSAENLISYAVRKNSTVLVDMIMEYANKHHILLDLFDFYDNSICSAVINAMKNDNIIMVMTLMKYINEHNIIFDINYKDKNSNDNLLSYATRKNNTELIEIIIDYANNHDDDLNNNFSYGINEIVDALLQNAMGNDNIKMAMVKYIFKNNIKIDMEHKNWDWRSKENNNKLIKRIINLTINSDNKKERSLENSMKNDNSSTVKMLMEYIINNNIIFDINDPIDSTGNNLLLYATHQNNTVLVDMIINYAYNNNIILDTDKQNNYKKDSLDYCIENKNVSIIIKIRDYIENTRRQQNNENNQKLKDFLKNNEEKIEFSECLCEEAFKNNNLEAIELLCESNRMKNLAQGINNQEYRCTENLKNILRNERFKFTSDFIITLLKYERLDYVKYIFEDYLYNNECIIKCLLYRKQSNRKDSLDNYIQEMIKNEKNKIEIDINEVFLMVRNQGYDSVDKVDYILDCANKNIITLTITIPYEKLLISAIATNNTKAVEWVMVQAKNNDIVINMNKKIFFDEFLSTSLSLYNKEIVKLILDYASEHNISLNLITDYNNNKICFPIMNAITNDNLEVVITIIKYLIEKDIDFDINYRDQFPAENLISYAVRKNSTELVDMIMEYANKHHISLNLFDFYDNSICSVVINAMKNDNINMVMKLMKYINEHNIIFNIYYKDENSNDNLLSYATKKNSTELMDMIKDYTNNVIYFVCIITILLIKMNTL